MLVLGIETSCDETAAAIVRDDGTVLSNIIHSQLDDHRAYGGVVPEIAARAHIAHLDGIVARALSDANVGFGDLDAVAATAGPGLIGGVMVGATMSKALALAAGKPFIAVNHLEGHALTPRLTDNVAFPYLLLLVSGGHCQLLAVDGVGRYERLGTTVDDAIGEAFDKTAKLLGLGFPGGPAVEAAARDARDPGRFPLSRPMMGRAGCDFSFAGLKTSVRQAADRLPQRDNGGLSPADRADLAAAFQIAAAEVTVDRAKNAIAMFSETRFPEAPTLVVAGGVAANTAIRAALTDLCDASGFAFVAPPPRLCTDNAAMIAWAGMERFRLGQVDRLDFKPRPRWPLTDLEPIAGVGA
ncbi:MAG: tRNA (adenosine(37)-N6)-threonylcarbamoyltransferase complex transferase subunit TsaD [Alphaproteobacteria bacterium]